MIRHIAGLAAVVSLSVVGCSDVRRPPLQKTRASVILVEVSQPTDLRPVIFEDDEYGFWSRNYGAKGEFTPGLFVFSKAANRWMRIDKLSTVGAKLGRAPTLEEGICSVGWNYSGLASADYADVPLRTSGSLNFPDKILYDTTASAYRLQFNSSWGIEAVLTEFVVRKDDLERYRPKTQPRPRMPSEPRTATD